MPFLLILVAIFAIVAALLAIGWIATKKVERTPGHDRYGSRLQSETYLHGAAPAVALGLTLVLLLVASFSIVPTRTIGVVTSFGKPVDTYSNGPHLKAPWEKVKKLDGTIQTDSRTGSDERPTGNDGASCTDVRIGNGSSACVDNSVRWRIKLDAGQRLYQDYPSGIDQIRKSLVQRQLTSALNDVLGDYNPLDQIKDQTGDVSVAPNLSQFSKDVKAALVERVGSDIQIEDVIIPIIRFDKNTQSKINAYQAEVANTRIAEQSEQTAIAQARANDQMRESVSNEPNVLVARCLDAFAEMVKDKQPIPIGFSCWPGGSASSVVLPTK